MASNAKSRFSDLDFCDPSFIDSSFLISARNAVILIYLKFQLFIFKLLM